jgi:hypothetical protein
MNNVQSYELSEIEFTDVTGGMENIEDIFSWGGFFFCQSEGFNEKKLYYVIHHFLMLDKIEPKFFLVTKDFMDEIKEGIKHKEKSIVDEFILSTLIEHGILKI